MDMPPSRYKVVEQGRRLVVLDSWNGNAPVTGHAVPPPVPIASARPATVEQARAAVRRYETGHAKPSAARPGPSGLDVPAAVFETRPWFDDKAPRRIRIDSRAQGQLTVVLVFAAVAAVVIFAMFDWPVLIVAAAIALQKGTRKMLRRTMTKWLDGMEQLNPN